MTLPALDPDDLGTDLAVTSGLPLRWGLATGNKNLGNALARRLSTPRGTLPWDPNYGFDLRDALNAGLTQTALSQLRGDISAECEKDERVKRADAAVTYNAATSALTVNITITAASGPFSLILLITALTVDILNANLPTVPTTQAPGAIVNIGITGPPGPPGGGSSGGGGGGGTTSIEATFPGRMGDSTGSAVVVAQATIDFNPLGGTITADLTFLANSAAGTAVIALYVGGTSNTVDGTLVGSVNVTGASDSQKQIGASFSNPTGARFVKLVITSSGAGVDAQAADGVVSFR